MEDVKNQNAWNRTRTWPVSGMERSLEQESQSVCQRRRLHQQLTLFITIQHVE